MWNIYLFAVSCEFWIVGWVILVEDRQTNNKGRLKSSCVKMTTSHPPTSDFGNFWIVIYISWGMWIGNCDLYLLIVACEFQIVINVSFLLIVVRVVVSMGEKNTDLWFWIFAILKSTVKLLDFKLNCGFLIVVWKETTSLWILQCLVLERERLNVKL